MIAVVAVATPALLEWLRQAHDDGAERLHAYAYAGATGATYVVVERRAGGDLSDAERVEVDALLAAHAAEPFTRPPMPGCTRCGGAPTDSTVVGVDRRFYCSRACADANCSDGRPS